MMNLATGRATTVPMNASGSWTHVDNLLLTILIPTYNEAGTIVRLLEKVITAPYRKQIVVIDDGSSDGTAAIVERWCALRDSRQRVVLLRHSENRGKGAAIRMGLELAEGEITLVQDADLEYDPQEYPAIVEPIRLGTAKVVYGSRYMRRDKALPWTAHRVCVRVLNFAVRLFYGVRITDEATCYKVFRTDLLQSLDLRCQRFEFCPEVTAKLCRLRVAIHEVPIGYRPRSAREGNKIGWRAGLSSFWTMLWWRFAGLAPSAPASAAQVDEPRARQCMGLEPEIARRDYS